MGLTHWGIVYYPLSSPRAPKIKCSFPVDANTNGREFETGDPCGLKHNDPQSGACKVSTPQEYANQYLEGWDGKTQWVLGQGDACSTPDISTMLEVQKELTRQYKARAPDEAYYYRLIGYNEVVVEEEEIHRPGLPSVIGFYFAHPGGFRENLTNDEVAWFKSTYQANGPPPQEWLNGFESLPFFELSGFTEPSSYGGPSQAMFTEMIDILEGKQSAPTGDGVIRLASKSMKEAVLAIARSAAGA